MNKSLSKAIRDMMASLVHSYTEAENGAIQVDFKEPKSSCCKMSLLQDEFALFHRMLN